MALKTHALSIYHLVFEGTTVSCSLLCHLQALAHSRPSYKHIFLMPGLMLREQAEAAPERIRGPGSQAASASCSTASGLLLSTLKERRLMYARGFPDSGLP